MISHVDNAVAQRIQRYSPRMFWRLHKLNLVSFRILHFKHRCHRLQMPPRTARQRHALPDNAAAPPHSWC